MTGNVVNFPFLKHSGRKPPPQSPALPCPWQSGQCVRNIKRPRSVGIIKAVHHCPIFKTVSSILVDFDTVREWCKPEELIRIPNREMS